MNSSQKQSNRANVLSSNQTALHQELDKKKTQKPNNFDAFDQPSKQYFESLDKSTATASNQSKPASSGIGVSAGLSQLLANTSQQVTNKDHPNTNKNEIQNDVHLSSYDGDHEKFKRENNESQNSIKNSPVLNPLISQTVTERECILGQNKTSEAKEEKNRNSVQSSFLHSFAVVHVKPNKPVKLVKQLKGIQKTNTDNLLAPDILQRILKKQKDQQQYGSLVMEQIGIAGIPSLWMSNQELLKQGYLIKDTLKLLEKYHKMFAVLRAHRKWENEKMFGKNSHALVQAGQAPVEFQYFRNNKIVSKFNENEQTQAQNEQEVQQLPLTRQYIRSFFPPGTQGTSQNNYADSENATYKMINSDKLIIKQVLETNNVQPASQDSQGWSLLWSCNALIHKQQIYESLTDYQKVNHFLNSTELTRKDRLYVNYMKMKEKFGQSEYNYLPETFILPEQTQEFKDAFNENQQRLKFCGNSYQNNQTASNFQKNQLDDHAKYQDNIWIVKPAQSSRGRGIYLLSDLKDIPKEEGEFVVSKYISNPLLISNHKFDLRIYVLVTSVDPLKVYVFNEGLVRFASEPYNHDYIKSGKFSHLTNYSINKKSENFIQNKTAQERDVGNKWSMSALQQHLTKLGINVKAIWARIYDMIIKSLISVESQMMCNTKKQNPNSSKPSNCFELLGYDVLLDSDLIPWILEVNLAPSLTADSPLDFHIKSNLVVDFFNLAGIRRPLKRNGKVNQRQVKQKSNSVAHNAQMTAQHAQTQYKGFTQDNITIQNSNSKEHMSSQSNLMKATPNPSVVGRNNMRKGNGTLSQGLGPESNFISYFDYGMSTGNARKTLIGGQQAAIPTYEGVEITILEKISKVSAKHRALLFETLWEFERNTRLNFTRIFPSPGCSYYDSFFETIRPNNKLIYKYLCQRTELWAIIEQSIYNDLEQTRNLDLPKEMTVIESTFENSTRKDQKLQENQSDFYQKEKEESVTKLNQDKSLIDKSEEVNNTRGPIKGITSPAKKEVDSLKGSFMERRKSMSRKQTGRKIKEAEENAMPTLTHNKREYEAEKFSRDRKQLRDETKMCSLIEDSVYEHSQIEEEDERNQESSVSLLNRSQTRDSSVHVNKQGKQSILIESQSKNTLKQKIKAPASGTQSSMQGSKEKKIESTFNSVVSQHEHQSLAVKMQIQVNQRISTGEQNVKPSIKDGKLVFEKTEPQSATIKPELDFPNISSPKNSLKQSIKEPQALATIRTSKSPIRGDLNRKDQNYKEKTDIKDYRCSSQSKLENIETLHKTIYKERLSSTNQAVDAKVTKKKKEKVVITGDDILIEYVRRIKNALKRYPIKDQPNNVIYYLEKFLYHKVWSLNDQNASAERMKDFKSADFRRKLKIRYIEMKSRRESVKAMDKTIEQKAHQNKETTHQYIDRMNKLRNDIVSALTSTQVEQMVIQSNQQNPIEIVSYLVGKKAENGGLLTRIERYGQKALALYVENQNQDDVDKKIQGKRSETQMNLPVRMNQFSSPNHSRQTQDESLVSSNKNLQRMNNGGITQQQFQSTIEKYKGTDKKEFEGFNTLNKSKQTQQFGSQPPSQLEKNEAQNDLLNWSNGPKDQQKQLQTPKSSNNKSLKIQHVVAGNNMATKTFRRQVTSGENETKSNAVAKNIYNTTTDISIADEDPLKKKIDNLNLNRFSFVQSKAVSQVNPNSRSHTYEEPTLYKEKRQLHTKIQHSNGLNKNIAYTIPNGQQKNMSNVESNKSLSYIKNSQFELPKQISQSPMHQIKNVHHHYTENKQQRTLDASLTGLVQQSDITSEQYILKNQQLNPSSSCSKQVLARKTTSSVDKTIAEQTSSEQGRNYTAKSYQDFEEEMRQKAIANSIQINPLPSTSPLILPKIEMQSTNQNLSGYKIIEGRPDFSSNSGLQKNQQILSAGDNKRNLFYV